MSFNSIFKKKILSIEPRVLDDILEESIDEDGCESSHNSSGKYRKIDTRTDRWIEGQTGRQTDG